MYGDVLYYVGYAMLHKQWWKGTKIAAGKHGRILNGKLNG
jgi:hypothetical protein